MSPSGVASAAANVRPARSTRPRGRPAPCALAVPGPAPCPTPRPPPRPRLGDCATTGLSSSPLFPVHLPVQSHRSSLASIEKILHPASTQLALALSSFTYSSTPLSQAIQEPRISRALHPQLSSSALPPQNQGPPRPLPLLKLAKTKHLSLAAKRALKAHRSHAKQHPALGSPSAPAPSSGASSPRQLEAPPRPSRSRPASASPAQPHPKRSLPPSHLASRAPSPSPLPSPSLLRKHDHPSKVPANPSQARIRSAYPSPSPSPAQPPAPVLHSAPSPSPSPLDVAHDHDHDHALQQPAPHALAEEDERGRSNHPRLLWRSVLEHDTVDALDEYCQVKYGCEMPKPSAIARHSAGSRGRPARLRKLTEVEAESWAKELDRTGF